MKCDLPYVNSFQDRHGRWRYYFRRKGGKAIPLPPPPASPAFIAVYNDCLQEQPASPPAIRSRQGSLSALRELYFGSAEFANLAPSTQREIRYVIDALCMTPNKNGGTRGDNCVATLERKHILNWRDKMKDRPGAANKMIRTLKGLLSFAVDRGMRVDNPAFRIKMFKTTAFRDWTDDELIQFEERWPLGTTERTGYALALYTAQRRADLAAMEWSSIVGNAILVRQSKTGTVMELPLHPELAKALKAVRPRRGKTILTGDRGKPLNPIYFGSLMAKAIEKAGLPHACVLHGLRKTTGRLLAEAGAGVSPITGHRTERMTAEYSRDANQEKLARASVLKWSKKPRQNRP